MIDITSIRWGTHKPAAILSAVLLGTMLLASPSSATAQTKRYALIVANNNSLDEGVSPLQFADDDGARFFELFEASGADTTLLSVPDADTQTKFPEASERAAAPTHRKLKESLRAIFSKIASDNAAGMTTHFTFIYAGHGNLGPNREGYINLSDERLTRSAFYAEIVGASPATFNHIILDACDSYFLVNKRGSKGPHRSGDYRQGIRDFMQTEQLSHYPNTGVILAASKNSETHEWLRLESGIFSHELISALLGTADVNEDGVITYQEAAACVEAANIGIPIEKARLKVYFRAPAGHQSLPIMDLHGFTDTATLHLDKAMGGRYYLEDARGVRIADLNFTVEQSVRLKLVGKAPFYLRTDNTEARVEVGKTTVDSKSLVFAGLDANHRGSIEQSFRKHLFEVPFGKSFYLGMFAAATGEESPRVDAPSPAVPASRSDIHREKASPNAVLGLTFLGTAAAAGIASGALFAAANASHKDYNAAEESEAAKELRETTETHMRLSRAFMGAGIGLGVAGASLLIVHAVQGRHPRKTASRATRIAPSVTAGPQIGTVGISGNF